MGKFRSSSVWFRLRKPRQIPNHNWDFKSAHGFLSCSHSYFTNTLLSHYAKCLWNLRKFCEVLPSRHCRPLAQHCHLRSFDPLFLKLHKYLILPQLLLPIKFKGVLTKFCRATLLLADFSDFDPKLLFVLEGILGSLLWKFGFQIKLFCPFELIFFSRTWQEQSIDLWLSCSFVECFWCP